jgi:hypothetical protein
MALMPGYLDERISAGQMAISLLPFYFMLVE